MLEMEYSIFGGQNHAGWYFSIAKSKMNIYFVIYETMHVKSWGEWHRKYISQSPCMLQCSKLNMRYTAYLNYKGSYGYVLEMIERQLTMFQMCFEHVDVFYWCHHPPTARWNELIGHVTNKSDFIIIDGIYSLMFPIIWFPSIHTMHFCTWPMVICSHQCNVSLKHRTKGIHMLVLLNR